MFFWTWTATYDWQTLGPVWKWAKMAQYVWSKIYLGHWWWDLLSELLVLKRLDIISVHQGCDRLWTFWHAKNWEYSMTQRTWMHFWNLHLLVLWAANFISYPLLHFSVFQFFFFFFIWVQGGKVTCYTS